MSALFGTTAPKEKTVLLVDVENGSVASGLVRLSDSELPKLFAQHRVALPILNSVSSALIAQNIEGAIEETLRHTSEVAARIRQNEKHAGMGDIESSHLFFAPPWTTATQNGERMQWSFEPSLVERISDNAKNTFGEAPFKFHPFSVAAGHAANSFAEGPLLLCIVTGEVTELLLLEDGRIQGRATIPVGVNTTLRTIRTHADMSFPEAESALRLHMQSPGGSKHLQSPIDAASVHFGEQFTDAAKELMEASGVRTIVVLAGPMGEWFARALTKHDAVARLFPDGGTARDIRAKHITPHFSMHATDPDLHLLVEAMFVSSQHNARNSIK